MSFLFGDAHSGTRAPGRSTNGLWLSVGVHALVGTLIVVTLGIPGKAPTPRVQPLKMFIAPVQLPAAPVVTPRLPDPPDPPPPITQLAKAEAPKPLPPPPVVTKPVEATPQPPAPAPAPERLVEKPAPRPPETGLFERTAAAKSNPAETAVTTGAFGNPVAQRNAATGVVTTGGFGNGPAARTAVTGEVQTADFDRRTSAPKAAAATAQPGNRPVEIVYKPTPEYTDEARSARIEGTVSLELEFAATGEVRVLRVVRGLGHGLDEAAQRAALRIRFKPAQSDSGPVVSRATVHITFRLS